MSDHRHNHAHTGSPGHSHTPASGNGDVRWLAGALILLVAFMIGEVAAGLAGHSLALLTDAGHLLTDAASLVLAIAAARIAARPAKGAYTYGFARVDALAGQANGVTLLLLAGWFAALAIRHLNHPPATAGGLLTAVALVGVAVNVAASTLVSRADRRRLSVQGAFAHLLNDLWAFVATAVAGVVILATGWTRADAIASLIVAMLMGIAGVGLLRSSARVFLEAAPLGLDIDALGGELAEIDGVAQVHDLHVWQIGPAEPAVSAHVLVRPNFDCHGVGATLRTYLDERHGLRHATLQLDHATSVGLDEHCAEAHGPVHSGLS